MKSFSNYIAYILAFVLIVILIWIIHRQIKEHHLQDDPMLHLLKKVLEPIKHDGKSITDNLKLYKGDKSYTINKEKIFLCLYDKDGEYYPMNMIVHVLLHEIAHQINRADVGHTENFYNVFNELTSQATALGIYNPSIPIIQDYCEY